ncbi:exonuclease domain-containing protein [Pseudonocardia zijingensis]|uniref:3'-5' exonuclease n=1 Tax=Pseudonocardia zijingensis TaxID=153376 RepID=A0ABP3YPR7_9PSEU
MTTDAPRLDHDTRCTQWRSNDPTRCNCRDEQGKTPRPPSTWADGPWVAFDTETTGVDTDNDRIVTATVIIWTPGHDLQVRSWLADPGVEIPDGAAAVHGITTEQAREHGRPAAEVVAEVTRILLEHWAAGCPLIGYNVGFDLSILAAELHRHHGTALPMTGPVVDPLVIDRKVDKYRRGSRKLVDVCRHYGVVLTDEDAHSADADALAAARLAWKIARAYPDEIGGVPLADLHTRQIGWHREWADGFGAYLASKGKPDDVQRDWPMRGAS